MHYGDYFTDSREQEALKQIVQQTKDMHAECWWTSGEISTENWGMFTAANTTSLG